MEGHTAGFTLQFIERQDNGKKIHYISMLHSFVIVHAASITGLMWICLIMQLYLFTYCYASCKQQWHMKATWFML